MALSSPVRLQGKQHKINPPLRVIVINCQSLANKKSTLLEMVDRVKPDIIIGTESWLKPKHLSSEFFPPNFYVFRKDRLNKKGGGTFVEISSKFTSSEVPDLEVNCELVWCRVEIRGSKDLFVSSFYRPPDANPEPLEQLENSLTRFQPTKH